ncbi:ABC transporter ATP-binding protein [Candidatus Bathyarchaeota archaeon]|nr:MAG: ABC transporter ATP-binding protein [Candidatus Bathyarchaeota archaeon]
MLAIIEARELTYTYPIGERPAFRDVNLKIEKGEFVIITGPSGCGKTTLCRCFNGLIPHFYGGDLEGEIYVCGLDVKEHPTYEIAQHVGMVLQNPENQLFALSVEKDVAFGLENLGVPREEIRKRIDWALKITGTYNLKNRPPYELSGGQQQRVAIASVLAMNPEVVVLDEPTSFLDPLGAERIIEVIGRLNREMNMTIILVEHRLDLVSRYANRIILMHDGRIVMNGDPREVLASEEARLIGIGIPKATMIYKLLKRRGIILDKPPLCSEEACQAIREVLNR